MSQCLRFATEAILRLEQNPPRADHFATCPECLAARAAYDRLREEIAALGERQEAPEHWKARVWEAIEERRRSRSRWLPWTLVPVGLAAALALFFVPQITRQSPSPASLTVEVQAQHAVIRRGTEAQPGDRLMLRATTGGTLNAELRVYGNDRELVLRCSNEPPCTRQDDKLRAALNLDTVGTYQPVLLISRRPLPRSACCLEEDTSAALAAGAEVELGQEIVVR